MFAKWIKAVAKAVLPHRVRVRLKDWLKTSLTALAGPDLRFALSVVFLRGSGIEIGALNRPLPVSDQAHVSYVDRITVAEARQHYQELDGFPLIEPDILTDGESLAGIPDGSQDFVIANHFLEHSEDPIGTVRNFARVLKPGGHLFLGLPDKRYTFDQRRPETTYQHVLRDHEQGPATSRREHYEEWVRLVEDISDPEQARGRSAELIGMDYKIHFHVWTPPAALEFLGKALQSFGTPYEVLTMTLNPANAEMIFVIKIGAEKGAAG